MATSRTATIPSDGSATRAGSAACPENSTSVGSAPRAPASRASSPTASPPPRSRAGIPPRPPPRPSTLVPTRWTTAMTNAAAIPAPSPTARSSRPGRLVGGQARHRQGHLVEAAPAPEADEDEVPDRGRDQPRQQRRDQRSAQPMPASSRSMPATSGPPNRAETAEKEPAVARTAGRRRLDQRRDGRADDRPSAISGASGPARPRTRASPWRRATTPGPCRQGGRPSAPRGAGARRRRGATSGRATPPRRRPRADPRRGTTEATTRRVLGRSVHSHPSSQVHQGQEQRRGQEPRGSRSPRPQQHQPQVGPAFQVARAVGGHRTLPRPAMGSSRSTRPPRTP